MPRKRTSPDAYHDRLDRVLAHIRANPADRHTVEDLAAIACFSPFHFHRLFTSLLGETVGECVRRIRLERAVALMRAAPGRTLSRIALEAGFASVAELSRAFRSRYGLAPSRWDRDRALVENRKYSQAGGPCRRYTDEELAEDHATARFTVVVRELPATRVVYTRVTDSYDPQKIMAGYTRFIGWLRESNDGALPPGRLIGMSHDDPDVTPSELCRYDFCWAGDVPASGPLPARTLPACRVASIHIDGDIETLCRAWDYIYRYWLPRSRWQPANLPGMEIYRRTPEEVGWEWFDLDGCIPVEAL